MFVPSQIVSLDGQNKSLFCEVIDSIDHRSVCWVRPILLVDLSNHNSDFYDYKDVCISDLRFTVDLLWNMTDFRLVLDTEYLEFFSDLEDFEFEEDKIKLANKKLRNFIQQLCEQKQD